MTTEEKLAKAIKALREIGEIVVLDREDAAIGLDEAQIIAVEALEELEVSPLPKIEKWPVLRLVKS